MMRVVLAACALVCSLSLASVWAQQASPPLWSGAASLPVVESTLTLNEGELRTGDVLLRAVRKPTRTARLAEDYAHGEGARAFTVPAGTPFFGSLWLSVPVAGAPAQPARRADDINWCTAVPQRPRVCFRWDAHGGPELGPMWGGLPLDSAPFDAFQRAPEPKLIEQPVEDLGLEIRLVVGTFDDAGLTVVRRASQGADSVETNLRVKWGEAAFDSVQYRNKYVANPLRSPRDEIVAARIEWQP